MGTALRTRKGVEKMERYKGAESFVEVLNTYGVEYIFFNPGIDTVPIQVTVSAFRESGKPAPGLVLCLDESVAMAAAHVTTWSQDDLRWYWFTENWVPCRWEGNA
jgi:hypothetical protein